MKLLAIALVLFACSKKAEDIDRGPELDRMAIPAIPGADGARLDAAMAQVTYDDVPEAALADAIAWREAGGGLSMRTAPRGQQLDIRPFKLGEALLARRGDDPAAIATVLYLAFRLREESPSFIGVAMGMALTQKVLEKRPAWQPEYAAWAPTEGEIRRGLAAEALMMLEAIPPKDRDARRPITGWYGELLVHAPAERTAFLAHVDRMIAKTKGSPLLEMLVIEKLHQRIEDMYKTIDDYHAWQGTLPKP